MSLSSLAQTVSTGISIFLPAKEEELTVPFWHGKVKTIKVETDPSLLSPLLYWIFRQFNTPFRDEPNVFLVTTKETPGFLEADLLFKETLSDENASRAVESKIYHPKCRLACALYLLTSTLPNDKSKAWDIVSLSGEELTKDEIKSLCIKQNESYIKKSLKTKNRAEYPFIKKLIQALLEMPKLMALIGLSKENLLSALKKMQQEISSEEDYEMV